MGQPDASQTNCSHPAWRLHQNHSDAVHGFRIGKNVLTVSSERSPYKRTANEDATLVMDLGSQRTLIAVADGVGGLRGGELAAEIALGTLQTTLSSIAPHQSLRTVVVDAIELANQQILDSQIAGASTIVVATIEHDEFRVFHVGDSQAIQVSNRGRVKSITIAHSPVGMAVEAGLLEESAAMHHEHRHLVNNIVGTDAMRIEIGATIKLAARDTLLLASDGLFDNLLPDEVASLVRKGNLLNAHRELIKIVRHRMCDPYGALPSKADDLSVICFRQYGGRQLPPFSKITERPNQ